MFIGLPGNPGHKTSCLDRQSVSIHLNLIHPVSEIKNDTMIAFIPDQKITSVSDNKIRELSQLKIWNQLFQLFLIADP